MTCAEEAVLKRIAPGERRIVMRVLEEVGHYELHTISTHTAQQAVLSLVDQGVLSITPHLFVERQR